MARLEGCHDNFRLWITAEPHEAFPIGLLQAGIKISNEAPVGMKAGLRTSLQWVSQARAPLLARFAVLAAVDQAEQSGSCKGHVACDSQAAVTEHTLPVCARSSSVHAWKS